MSTNLGGSLSILRAGNPLQAGSASDDDDEDDDGEQQAQDSGGEGVLGRATSGLSAVESGVQSGLDAVFDREGASVRDTTSEALADAAGAENVDEFAEDLGRDYEQFLGSTGPVQRGREVDQSADPEVYFDTSQLSDDPGTIEALAATRVGFGDDADIIEDGEFEGVEQEAERLDETGGIGESLGQFTTETFTEPVEETFTLTTGIDAREGEADQQPDLLGLVDVATLGGAKGVSTLSRIAREGSSSTSMASRLGRLLRGADEAADTARGADDVISGQTDVGVSRDAASRTDTALDASLANRASESPEAAASINRGDNLGLTPRDNLGLGVLDESDPVGDVGDDLPAVADDVAGAERTVASAGDDVDDVVDVPSTVLDDPVEAADDSGSLFASVTDSVRNAGRALSDAVTPRRAAVAGTAGLAGAGGAAIFAGDDGGGTGGGGGGGGGVPVAGDDSGDGDGGAGVFGAPERPGDIDGPLVGGFDARLSIDDMPYTESQTVVATVTNGTGQSVSTPLTLALERADGAAVADQASVNIAPDGERDVTFTIPPTSQQFVGRQTALLYASGAPGRTDGVVLDRTTFRITEPGSDSGGGESGSGGGGSEEWGDAYRVQGLEGNWYLFGQDRNGESRYFIIGADGDGGELFIDGSGNVADSPTFFDTVDEALEAHAAWFESSNGGQEGETPDQTAAPPDSQRATRAAGRGGGGTFRRVTDATGVTGDESLLSAERAFKLALTSGVVLYILDYYGYIDVSEWPILNEVL